MDKLRKNEHLEIKITEVVNGYVIEKSQWIDETCASTKETWIAHDAEKVKEIVYNLTPKG